MTTEQVQTSTNSAFISRVLRWIGVLSLALGTIVLLRVITRIYVNGGSFFLPPRSSSEGDLLRFIINRLLSASEITLLVFGGIGLLNWKRWAPVVLVIWACFDVSLELLLGAANVYYHPVIMRVVANSPAHLHLPSMQRYTWNLFLDVCAESILPVLIAAILLQPEVRRLWQRRAGPGFEVGMPSAGEAN